jgi:hypothetical protein
VPGGRPLHRPIAAAGGLCLALAAACSAVPVPAHHPSAATHSPAHPAPASLPAQPPMALQVTPAPYQLPTPIAREVVLAQGGGLLIVGGLTQASATTSAISVLNPMTGKVTRAGRLALPSHDAAGALLAGQAYVFGGGAAATVADVQALHPGGTAVVAAQLPQPRSDVSAVTLGSTAYLLGGYDGATYDRRVFATSDGRVFRRVATLPVPVRYPAVAGVGRQIWLFGGQTPSGLTGAIQQVSLDTGKAAVVGHLPDPATGAAAFVLGGRVYVAGGQVLERGQASGPVTSGPGLITSNQVLAFDPAHDVMTAAGQLPVPVANAAAAVLAGTAYLIGGNDGQRQVATVTQLRLVAPSAADPSGPSSPVVAREPWLGSPHGPGHLAPHSDPAALPSDILIADNWNNRLLIVDPQGRIRWEFPRPGDLGRGQSFLLPDDAFFSPDGRDIIATEEEDSVISVIDIARHKIVYRYGTPGVAGSADNHVANPDDAMMMPGGTIISADIENCRLLLLSPPSHRPHRVIGQTGVCAHDPPHLFTSPNGAFPATNGDYLVTEINGDWASEIGRRGHLVWSTHPPGVAYPSDTNEVYPGRYLTADYSSPGQVVEFDSRGRLLWRFGGLDHPSLALPLPNGDILVNDDYNDRVIVIDPAAHRIVWQYGHTGRPGTAPGYLNDPDGVDLTPPDSMLISHAGTMGRP